jgi:hypothetical protein
MLRSTALLAVLSWAAALPAHADENLFGYVRGAETLPKDAQELYQWFTVRSDKGAGSYRALDLLTEYERGVTDRFSVAGELRLMQLDTSGLLIDGYLPGDKKLDLRPTGLGFEAKYNFLSPAKDDFGLSGTAALEYAWIDPHSGQKKSTLSAEFGLQMQKYYLDGQLVVVGNAMLEATRAKREPIDNLPAGFDWPTTPEMEIEPTFGAGFSYRFAPGWFAGLEAVYQSEYETEVDQERWTVFAGPSVHYAAQKWWGTLTLMRQLRGGGETFAEQGDNRLHLIEKTRHELRLKLGFNF